MILLFKTNFSVQCANIYGLEFTKWSFCSKPISSSAVQIFMVYNSNGGPTNLSADGNIIYFCLSMNYNLLKDRKKTNTNLINDFVLWTFLCSQMWQQCLLNLHVKTRQKKREKRWKISGDPVNCQKLRLSGHSLKLGSEEPVSSWTCWWECGPGSLMNSSYFRQIQLASLSALATACCAFFTFLIPFRHILIRYV